MKAIIELDSDDKKVEEIITHPNWSSFEEKYNADIALLVLKNSVEFSMFIRPICFPPTNDIKFSADEVEGTVVSLTLKFLNIHVKKSF